MHTIAELLDAASVKQARHRLPARQRARRSEEHTSELQSQSNLVCRLLLEKKKSRRARACAAALAAIVAPALEEVSPRSIPFPVWIQAPGSMPVLFLLAPTAPSRTHRSPSG